MKVTLSALAFLLASPAAFADGFVCHNSREALSVKVFNNTDPSAGTRNGAVMVLSDLSVGAGNKTIARFTDSNLTLSNQSSKYAAKVDHRFNDSNRKGELIAGTNIGALAQVNLDLDFSYARPVAHGAFVRGTLGLIKRNGQTTNLAMDCSRYLKN
jgi:hypothetical protein